MRAESVVSVCVKVVGEGAGKALYANRGDWGGLFSVYVFFRECEYWRVCVYVC